METKKQVFQTTQKKNIENVLLHLYLTEKQVHYVLFITQKNELLLYSILPQGAFSLLSRYDVYTGNPIQFITDAQDNVILLHSAGICIWSITQVLQKCQPQKIDLKWFDSPLKLIPLGSSEYVVVCSKGKLMFVGREGERRECEYDQEYVMEKAQHENLITTEDCLFVLIPSRTKRYPYLFNRNDMKKWEKAGFLQAHIKACMKYYLEDQVLPSHADCMTFYAKKRLVYVLLKEQLRILEWHSNSEVGLLFCMRMRVHTSWNEPRLACYANKASGALIYSGPERIGQMKPLEYQSLKASIKQPELAINFVYHLGEYLVMIALHGPMRTCKMYITRATISS